MAAAAVHNAWQGCSSREVQLRVTGKTANPARSPIANWLPTPLRRITAWQVSRDHHLLGSTGELALDDHITTGIIFPCGLVDYWLPKATLKPAVALYSLLGTAPLQRMRSRH